MTKIKIDGPGAASGDKTLKANSPLASSFINMLQNGGGVHAKEFLRQLQASGIGGGIFGGGDGARNASSSTGDVNLNFPASAFRSAAPSMNIADYRRSQKESAKATAKAAEDAVEIERRGIEKNTRARVSARRYMNSLEMTAAKQDERNEKKLADQKKADQRAESARAQDQWDNQQKAEAKLWAQENRGNIQAAMNWDKQRARSKTEKGTWWRPNRGPGPAPEWDEAGGGDGDDEGGGRGWGSVFSQHGHRAPGGLGRMARAGQTAYRVGGAMFGGEALGAGEAAGAGGILGAEGGPIAMAIGAVIATAIYEAVKLPRTIASAQQGMLNEATPYINSANSMRAFGRAGGFRGMDIESALYPADRKPPEWMAATGTSGSDVMESMARIGLSPRSSASFMAMAQQAAEMRVSPALSNMPEGTSEDIIRRMRGVGLDPKMQANALGQVAALSDGIDKSKVLPAMLDSLEKIQAASMGVNQQGFNDMFLRMASSGMPGALTGQDQAATMSGMKGALDAATGGADKAKSTMMLQYMAQANLTTEDSVHKAIGDSAWNKAKNDPSGIGQQAIDTVIRNAKAGKPFGMGSFNDLISGDLPEFYKNQYGPFISKQTGLTGDELDYAKASSSGQLDPGGSLRRYRENQLPTPLTGSVADRSNVLMDKFIKAGFSPEQAAGFVGGLTYESGGKLDPQAFNGDGGGHGAKGIGQWRGPRQDAFRAKTGHDLSQSTDIGEQGDFAISELHDPANAGILKRLKDAKTPEEAAALWELLNERPAPGDVSKSVAGAARLSQSALSNYRNRQSPPGALSAENAPIGGPEKTIADRADRDASQAGYNVAKAAMKPVEDATGGFTDTIVKGTGNLTSALDNMVAAIKAATKAITDPVGAVRGTMHNNSNVYTGGVYKMGQEIPISRANQ